jgi:hypothetical protein
MELLRKFCRENTRGFAMVVMGAREEETSHRKAGYSQFVDGLPHT